MKAEIPISDALRVKVDPACSLDQPIFAPMNSGDVGYDLACWLDEDFIEIPPHESVDIPTGISVKLPSGTWAEIRPRSSTIFKRKLIVGTGTIDSGYVGPLSVCVINVNTTPVKVHRGERLAQLVLMTRIVRPIVKVDILPETERGQNAMGSTGGFHTRHEVIEIDKMKIDTGPPEGLSSLTIKSR
jgi:dUTP pyrophosphatase